MVETVPPLLGAGVRFLTAGAILLTAVLLLGRRKRLRVTPREALAAAAVGILILVGGIGLLTLAERRLPSGLAALLIASVPRWVVLLRLIAKERVPRTTLAGVAGGFVGVAILVLPGDRTGDAPLGWLAVLLAAALFTAIGALASERLTLPQDTMLSTALEMGCAGAVLVLIGLAVAKSAQFDPTEISPRSLMALAFLVLIGSVVAYSAFVWLLQNASASTVATYAYVNPAVALILGWAMWSEQITPTILVGALMILACVALAARGEEKRTAEEESDPRRYSDDLAPSRTARSDHRDDSASSS
ncbi:MAG: EamA family transporter [Solirubrobacteraceae bacterium]